MNYQYYIADVFTDRVFQGAQIAVFPHAQGLNKDTMQSITKEMNLSETVFIFKSAEAENHYQIRTFSPQIELDFSGHPLIAAAWVLASIGDLKLKGEHTPLIFEQSTGPVECYVTVDGDQPTLIQFTMPVNSSIDRFVPTDKELTDILSLDVSELENKKLNPLLVSCGKNYLIIPIRTYSSVRKARFNFKAWSSSSAPSTLAKKLLLVTPTQGADKSNFHARIVGPDIGQTEDPPIGSAMPAFAAYLCEHQHIKTGTHIFTIDRGTESTRRSQLNIEMDNKPDRLVLRVGGPAVLVSEGLMTIPNGC
ncbi:MAG: PhzF family phenazine biosynthesis protein [Methylococcales bacterium]